MWSPSRWDLGSLGYIWISGPPNFEVSVWGVKVDVRHIHSGILTRFELFGKNYPDKLCQKFWAKTLWITTCHMRGLKIWSLSGFLRCASYDLQQGDMPLNHGCTWFQKWLWWSQSHCCNHEHTWLRRDHQKPDLILQYLRSIHACNLINDPFCRWTTIGEKVYFQTQQVQTQRRFSYWSHIALYSNDLVPQWSQKINSRYHNKVESRLLCSAS